MSNYDDLQSRVAELTTQHAALRGALVDMVEQFAYWHDGAGGYWTGGLSALEEAFAVLGWPDPHPCPAARCDEPGCLGKATCGKPTASFYRTVCRKHYRALTSQDATNA